MFDFVRNHTRLALGFMLLLIIPSFVFFGIDGYTRFSGGANTTVAKVDGVSITQAEWESVHQRAVDRVRRQNPEQDAKSLDTPEVRQEALDSLVRDRVLLAAANQMHLTPSDERLKRLFASDPQFAAFRNADGSVNRELLAMQGMSSEMFAQQLRQQFAVQQVMAGMTRSVVSSSAIAAASLDPLLQRREIQLQRFDPAAYRAQINPSEAEIEAFYKTQQAGFRSPERADIEYAVLDLDSMRKGVTVADEELRKFYTDNAARYTAPEERRASHVLIKTDKDSSAADKAKAKARAEELLAQARKNPVDFAELARKNSQDTGTAAQGGDLDFFGRGAMVKPFETAAFTLKQGDISDVFETDFGFHFLTVTGVRGGQKKAFEEVRAEIDAELRKAKAKAEWAKVAEQFTNTVYEQSDSLQPVIDKFSDKFKLDKKTATVQRTPMPGASGPLVSAKLLEAVFGNEAGIFRFEDEGKCIRGEHRKTVAGIGCMPRDAKLEICSDIFGNNQPTEIINLPFVKSAVLFLITVPVLNQHFRTDATERITSARIVIRIDEQIVVKNGEVALPMQGHAHVNVILVVGDIDILVIGRFRRVLGITKGQGNVCPVSE